MHLLNLILLSFAAIVLSGLCCGMVARWGIQLNLVDLPGERRSHDQPTARGGGIGIWVAWCVFSLLLWQHFQVTEIGLLWLASTLMMLVGALDDRFSLSARLRFIAQIIISSGFAIAVSSGAEVPVLMLAVLVVAMVWSVNAFNFMDGINGIAALQVIFASLAYCLMFALSGDSVMALTSLLLTLVVLGFLPWNFPQARLFMGDSGSYLLGFLLAALALLGYTRGTVSLIESLLIWSVFFVDTGLTLLMRISRGEAWYRPHRQHAYQQLAKMGFSHARISSALLLINLIFILPLLCWLKFEQAWQWAWTVVVYLSLMILWLIIQRIAKTR